MTRAQAGEHGELADAILETLKTKDRITPEESERAEKRVGELIGAQLAKMSDAELARFGLQRDLVARGIRAAAAVPHRSFGSPFAAPLGRVELELADEAFDVVLPGDPKSPGYRLHLYREPFDLLWFAEESVLPEKVAEPKANRVKTSERLCLTTEQVRWLRDRFTEVLAIADAERSQELEERIATLRAALHTALDGWEEAEGLFVEERSGGNRVAPDELADAPTRENLRVIAGDRVGPPRGKTVTTPSEIACEMMIDGPNVEHPRSCGALPTVGTNGIYRYCEHHMARQAAAGATTLVFDDGSKLVARRCATCQWRGVGRPGGPCPECAAPQCRCGYCAPQLADRIYP
jgi:hypothetical protein